MRIQQKPLPREQAARGGLLIAILVLLGLTACAHADDQRPLTAAEKDVAIEELRQQEQLRQEHAQPGMRTGCRASSPTVRLLARRSKSTVDGFDSTTCPEGGEAH